jgi:hypothetical protein
VNTYLIDQPVFLRAYLTDPSTGDPNDAATQDPVDDSTIALTVYAPDGTTQTPSLTHVATGEYTTSITPDQAGTWWYYSLSIGNAAGRNRERFYVEPVRYPTA